MPITTEGGAFEEIPMVPFDKDGSITYYPESNLKDEKTSENGTWEISSESDSTNWPGSIIEIPMEYPAPDDRI